MEDEKGRQRIPRTGLATQDLHQGCERDRTSVRVLVLGGGPTRRRRARSREGRPSTSLASAVGHSDCERKIRYLR